LPQSTLIEEPLTCQLVNEVVALVSRLTKKSSESALKAVRGAVRLTTGTKLVVSEQSESGGTVPGLVGRELFAPT
jgi:hypothetical protein